MAVKTKKILIVEDEKTLAEALRLKLGKEGYPVDVAHDGRAGLELMSKQRYDVVLLDLMMPIMDGYEVLKAARKLPDAPAFIVLSNLIQPENAERCIELGARKLLVKSETPLATIVAEIESL